MANNKRLALLISLLFMICHHISKSQPFSKAEQTLILSGDTSKLLRIIPLSEPEGKNSLRAISTDINWNDPLLPLLKERMLKSVMDSNHKGVGIAAPQVGINRNLIWVKRFDKKNNPFEFFINPKIIWHSKLLRKGFEGDLSFKENWGDVVRSHSIFISYTDTTGRQHIEMLEDFTAVIFQHETDHLFGILLTDRLAEQKNKKYSPYQSFKKGELLSEEAVNP